MSEQSCLFCKIIAGQIPSNQVYQDEECVAFRDINPQAPSHILVVPRKHVASLDEACSTDEPALGHLLTAAAQIARDEGLVEGGYRTVINTGAGAGQSVFHIHLHLLGGRRMGWPPG